MKLIKPSWEILEQKPSLEGIYEAIETAGRLCYKSTRPEGKTAKDFVDMLIKNGHLAMLEHGTVYLKYPTNDSDVDMDGNPCCVDTVSGIVGKYMNNPHSKVNSNEDISYITTNYRVLVENDWLEDLEFLCEPTEFHEKRVGVHFTTSIGIGREFLRHRKFSFANESTRYCNYSSEKKFGSELTFIIPTKFNRLIDEWSNKSDSLTKESFESLKNEPIDSQFHFLRIHDRGWVAFEDSLKYSEQDYMYLITEEGWTPQEAREALPLPTKSELIMTGFISDWENFFDLRARGTTGKAHPDAVALAKSLMDKFYELRYIERNLETCDRI